MMKISSEVFRLQILVNKKPVQEYRGTGGNTFVEGKHGSNFELEISNLTVRRLLVHPTVDGLSAMTGKEASKNDWEHGYVLNAFQSMRVPGWRLNDKEVAKFVFAGEGGSYAEQSGHGADRGVIACAVWEENYQFTYLTDPGKLHKESHKPAQSPLFYDYRPPTYNYGGGGRFTSHSRSCNLGEQPTAGSLGDVACYTAQNLGTGFGKKADHQVITVSFTPQQEQPNCIAVVYYDDRQGLQRRGINISKKKEHRLPNPFPKDTGCTPPDGWQG